MESCFLYKLLWSIDYKDSMAVIKYPSAVRSVLPFVSLDSPRPGDKILFAQLSGS